VPVGRDRVWDCSTVERLKDQERAKEKESSEREFRSIESFTFLFQEIDERDILGTARESPPGDISFPDLSFYGTGESRSDTYLLPGVRTPHEAVSHLGRGGAKASHPLPSIASQLFPQAPIREGSTFGFGETPRMAPAYEPGMGKPPVAKRPRSRAGELRLGEGARNATGRNVSGNGGVSRAGSPIIFLDIDSVFNPNRIMLLSDEAHDYRKTMD